MFRSMAISSEEAGNVLRIDDITILSARRISDAKYYSEQRGVAAVYEKNGKRSVVFVIKADDVPGKLLQHHIEPCPQPKEQSRIVLEVGLATDLPFAHYSAENGYIYIVTQTGITGPFERQEGERLLEHLRKEMWNFCVMNK